MRFHLASDDTLASSLRPYYNMFDTVDQKMEFSKISSSEDFHFIPLDANCKGVFCSNLKLTSTSYIISYYSDM